MVDYTHKIVEDIQSIKRRVLANPSAQAFISDKREFGRTVDRMVQAFEIAHRFDFSQAGAAYDPDLVNVALEMWRDDELPPLPFEVCTFTMRECPAAVASGGVMTGQRYLSPTVYLIIADDKGFTATRFIRMPDGGGWTFPPYLTHLKVGEKFTSFGIYDYARGSKILPIAEGIMEQVAAEVLAALVALNSRNARTRPVEPPAALNRARIKRGKFPLVEYRVVEIGAAPGERAHLGGSHEAPRLHWRRGHTRHLASGASTKVRPHLVGDLSRGMVEHDYAVRS